MENNTGNSTGLKVALAILLALFVGTGFYTSQLYKDKKDTEQQLTEEKELVMNDLSAMASQYDLAIKENEISNENLIEARSRIEGLIDSLKVSQTSVRSLWKYKKKNDQLRIDNSLLASTLDSTRIQLAERSVFTDSLLMQNTELATVVEDAAVLGTAGLKGFGVIERSSGKLIPTEKARRTDKVRVCYTVAKNNLVPAGDHELYVQVLDPKGNVMGANEQISFDDQTLNYSVISKFNYENRNLNICEFVTTGDKDFEKGNYTVNVFNKKDLVSTSEFTLK